LTRYQFLPVALTASEACSRPREVGPFSRARWHKRHAQFHCGYPPPAAVPTSRKYTGGPQSIRGSVRQLCVAALPSSHPHRCSCRRLFRNTSQRFHNPVFATFSLSLPLTYTARFYQSSTLSATQQSCHHCWCVVLIGVGCPRGLFRQHTITILSGHGRRKCCLSLVAGWRPPGVSWTARTEGFIMMPSARHRPASQRAPEKRRPHQDRVTGRRRLGNPVSYRPTTHTTDPQP